MTSEAGGGVSLVQRLHRRATEISLSVALLLIAIKLFAYFATQSISVLSTALDSGLDAAASLLNLAAVRLAQQPPDDEHRFGHGKAEPLAGLAQTIFVAVSAGVLIASSIAGLLNPAPIHNEAIGLAVIILSIALTVMVVGFQRYALRQSPSVAVAADEMHYRGDLYLNLGVLASLLLSKWFGWQLIDPLFGLGIGFYLIINSWKIFQQSFQMLMDRELPDADRERIRRICLTHEGVLDAYGIRTRQAGPRIFIHVTLEMDGSLTLRSAHFIGHDVEAELLAAFPGAEIIIHEEPTGVDGRHRAGAL
jgi:ferrous-iron efflux pump FieF